MIIMMTIISCLHLLALDLEQQGNLVLLALLLPLLCFLEKVALFDDGDDNYVACDDHFGDDDPAGIAKPSPLLLRESWHDDDNSFVGVC